MMANAELAESGKHSIECDELTSSKRVKVEAEVKVEDKVKVKDEVDDNSISQQPVIRSKPDPTLYGLTEFINTSFNPISGDLKERFEDFIVTEIERSGNVARLTSYELPILVEEAPPSSTSLTPDQIEHFNKLLAKEVETVKLPAPADKEERKNIHTAIKQFSSQLFTTTAQEGEEKFIVVSTSKSNFDKKKFPKGRQYCHFTLYKWNIGTQEALSRLCSTLQVKSNRFSFAGNKDKRGVTSQRVSVFCITAERLNGINKKHLETYDKPETEEFMKGPPYLMGNFTYESSQLHLGQLSGNRFTITLRGMTASDEDIKLAVESCRDNGFINYFGMQRFGNTGCNHKVGKHLLSQDFKSAVETVLMPNGNQKYDVLQATTHFKNTADARSSYNKLRHSKWGSEGLILGFLSKHPKNKNNFFGAFNELAQNTKSLYLHSYQSYIWNLTLSKRLQKFGTKVLPGDLVYNPQVSEGQFWAKRTVRKITAEEVDQTCISDIVLPLFGHSVEMPDNDCKQFIVDLLKEDNLTLEKLAGLHRQLSLPGEYRQIIVKPTEVSWRCLHYTSDEEKLVLTDEDIMRGVELPPLDIGEKKALQMSFNLTSSTYATMMMRELTRGYTDK